METAVFAYILTAAALWAGLLTLAVVARPRHRDDGHGRPAIVTLLRLWGWLALVVTVAGAGTALAGTEGLVVAVLALVFASIALFAAPSAPGRASVTRTGSGSSRGR